MAKFEYRTYAMTAGENDLHGYITLDGNGFDWHYADYKESDRSISLEKLGLQGFRLIHAVARHGSTSLVGIFEREIIEPATPQEVNP